MVTSVVVVEGSMGGAFITGAGDEPTDTVLKTPPSQSHDQGELMLEDHMALYGDDDVDGAVIPSSN